MSYEFKISTQNGEYSIFAQQSFYEGRNLSHGIHRHNNNEIHIVYGEGSLYSINNQDYFVPGNTLLFIPQGTLHACVEEGENTWHCAFRTDYTLTEFGSYPLDESIVKLFFKELNRLNPDGNYNNVASYISLILSLVDGKNEVLAKPIGDIDFHIDSFFETRYADDVNLKDLAKMLNLSERQTERLVIKQKGDSFRKVLAQKRIEMAHELMKDTSLTLTEIAFRVGYKSYSGFWKSMKNR